MSIYRLREILRYHNLLDCGNKDELVIRVGMLRVNRSYLAFHREREGISNIITATRTLIRLQKELILHDPKMIYKRRFFSTPSGSSLSLKRPRYHASVPGKNYHNCLAVPTGINMETLEEILDPLQSEIGLYD